MVVSSGRALRSGKCRTGKLTAGRWLSARRSQRGHDERTCIAFFHRPSGKTGHGRSAASVRRTISTVIRFPRAAAGAFRPARDNRNLASHKAAGARPPNPPVRKRRRNISRRRLPSSFPDANHVRFHQPLRSWLISIAPPALGFGVPAYHFGVASRAQRG
jgi:hypothetical protein